MYHIGIGPLVLERKFSDRRTLGDQERSSGELNRRMLVKHNLSMMAVINAKGKGDL